MEWTRCLVCCLFLLNWQENGENYVTTSYIMSSLTLGIVSVGIRIARRRGNHRRTFWVESRKGKVYLNGLVKKGRILKWILTRSVGLWSIVDFVGLSIRGSKHRTQIQNLKTTPEGEPHSKGVGLSLTVVIIGGHWHRVKWNYFLAYWFQCASRPKIELHLQCYRVCSKLRNWSHC